MNHITRRSFLGTLAAGAAGAVLFRSATGAEPKRRRFTMDLRCGSIGVRAGQREAIELAHRFGFESVEPSAPFLAKLSPAELDALLGELKAKNLVWGAAGLPVDFRKDEETFKTHLAKLPELAEGLRRAGVSRVGTWLSPSHSELTYLANFRQHVRRLGQVARVLGDHGQRFGLEYVGPKTSWTAARHPFIHTMAEARS